MIFLNAEFDGIILCSERWSQMTIQADTMGEQPIFTCKAHVFHIDPKTKRWDKLDKDSLHLVALLLVPFYRVAAIFPEHFQSFTVALKYHIY